MPVLGRQPGVGPIREDTDNTGFGGGLRGPAPPRYVPRSSGF